MSLSLDTLLSSAALRKSTLATVIAALCAGHAVNVSAQDEALVLEEIVVSAQKREQSLQDVPMSISALSAQSLRDAGVQSVSDVSRQAPVLEVQSSVSPVMTNLRIRRVGNLGNIPTFEPAVGLFVDGAFRSRALFGATDLFDLDRIEILRGPQSTLYGKNTTAGVMAIYTTAPSEMFKGGAEATVGTLDGGVDNALSTSFKGSLSGPISDTFRASLGGSYTKADAVLGEGLTNTGEAGNDTNRYSVRGQLELDVTDAFNVRMILGAVSEDDKKETSDITYDPNGPFSTLVLPTWRAAGVSDTCSSNDPHDRITCVQQPLTTDLKAKEATLLARYTFANDMTLNSISSWDNYLFKGTMNDVAQMQAPLLQFHDRQESDSLQQELRLASAGGQTVDWLFGAFYYSNSFERGDDKTPVFVGDTFAAHPAVGAVNRLLLQPRFPGVALPLIPVAAAGQVGFLDSSLDTEYLAAYNQTTWNMGDYFNITAGVRWATETKEADIQQWVNIPGMSLVSLLLSPTAVSANGLERKTDAVTWSVTPQLRISDDSMVFATAAHGFKSGGFNTGFGALSIPNREFKDEDIMHYELGTKLEPTGQLRLAANVFYTVYEDYQDAAFVGAQFTVGNAEKALLKGAEFEATWLLSDLFTADAAVSYADLTYDKNTAGQCYPGRASDSTTMAGACDLSGEHPVNAPEWKAHVGLQYTQPVGWGDLFARSDLSWTDQYNTSFSADPRLKQDAYHWLTLRAGTRWGDNYELAFWADNVTNETVVNLDPVLTLYAGDNSYQSLLQSPRSFGATFRVNF